MFWSSWQAYLLVEFLQNFGLFLDTVLGDREMFFFLTDTPQKVDNSHPASCFTYSFISSVQF